MIEIGDLIVFPYLPEPHFKFTRGKVYACIKTEDTLDETGYPIPHFRTIYVENDLGKIISTYASNFIKLEDSVEWNNQ